MSIQDTSPPIPIIYPDLATARVLQNCKPAMDSMPLLPVRVEALRTSTAGRPPSHISNLQSSHHERYLICAAAWRNIATTRTSLGGARDQLVLCIIIGAKVSWKEVSEPRFPQTGKSCLYLLYCSPPSSPLPPTLFIAISY